MYVCMYVYTYIHSKKIIHFEKVLNVYPVCTRVGCHKAIVVITVITCHLGIIDNQVNHNDSRAKGQRINNRSTTVQLIHIKRLGMVGKFPRGMKLFKLSYYQKKSYKIE